MHLWRVHQPEQRNYNIVARDHKFNVTCFCPPNSADFLECLYWPGEMRECTELNVTSMCGNVATIQLEYRIDNSQLTVSGNITGGRYVINIEGYHAALCFDVRFTAQGRMVLERGDGQPWTDGVGNCLEFTVDAFQFVALLQESTEEDDRRHTSM
ncbi:hypothetical protein F5Y04DRAFT_282063 [Hypomontagnella monticulosa]|nr:hypothetical protein F5Y04DRAFT_282063 [Hypomontagnella monticulosa]